METTPSSDKLKQAVLVKMLRRFQHIFLLAASYVKLSCHHDIFWHFPRRRDPYDRTDRQLHLSYLTTLLLLVKFLHFDLVMILFTKFH